MAKSMTYRVAAAMLTALAFGAARADPPDDEGCSNRTLHGLYLFSGSGYNIVNGAPLPKVILETLFMYGDGYLTVPYATNSINGVIGHSAPNGPGSYAVGRDCLGVLQFGPPGPGFELVVAPGGEEFFMIQTNANTVLQGRVVRISP